eukprot:Nk52_evm1s1498 gene=Nk52_evmTU1s1498
MLPKSNTTLGDTLRKPTNSFETMVISSYGSFDGKLPWRGNVMPFPTFAPGEVMLAPDGTSMLNPAQKPATLIFTLLDEILPYYDSMPMVYDLFSGTGTVAAVASLKGLSVNVYEKHPQFIPAIAARINAPRLCDTNLHITSDLEEVLTPIERIPLAHFTF